MRMDLCTDLMGSGSWILTIICVSLTVVLILIWPDLSLQPARTTVPGVSYQLFVQSYFVIIKNLGRQTECFSINQ